MQEFLNINYLFHNRDRSFQEIIFSKTHNIVKMMYLIPENIKAYIKSRGDKYTLIIKKEICNKCKATLEDKDYIYRRKAPNVRTYLCSKCGYFEVYIME